MGVDQVILYVLLSFAEAVISDTALHAFVPYAVTTYNVFIGALYPLKALPVLLKLTPEIFQAFKCLLLFCLYWFLLCKLAIVVYGTREGRQ